jgi:hypothetical protein
LATTYVRFSIAADVKSILIMSCAIPLDCGSA